METETKSLSHADKIIQLNQRLLSTRYPHKDPIIANVILHAILGQLPAMLHMRYNIYASELDLRTHVTVLSPSGTNKGSIFTYMNDLCTALGMKFKIMGKFTDSALVGTPNTKTEKVDIIDEETGEPKLDDKKKPMKKTERVDDHIYGALHPKWGNNILAWSEGSQVLDVKQANFNQSTMNILQQCMNPMGTPDNIVSKTTGLGEISYNTNCSIFLVTYKPYTLTEKIISTGFLQRQIVIIRDSTSEQSMITASNACAGLTRKPEIRASVDELVKLLADVDEFIAKQKSDSLYVPDGVKDHLEFRQLDFHEKIKNTNILVREKLGEFVRRWSVNIFYNLMFHHALLDLRTEVRIEDIEYANDLLYPIWCDYVAFLENALLMDRRETEAIGKQYASIVIAYKRMEKEAQETRSQLPPEKQYELEQDGIYDFVRREELINRVSMDWARSRSAVEETFRQIETDLFITKTTCAVPPEERPDGVPLHELPVIHWLKFRPGAMRVISFVV